MSLPRRLLLAYGLPGLPMAVLGLPLFIYLPTVYATDHGLGLTAVGSVLLLARLWDGLTDPLIGLLGDRTNTRWGRRRPWMLAGLAPTLLAMVMLFVPPAGVDVGYLLLWSMVLYLGWTMIALPHAAWGAELSPDYHERSRIAAAREGFVVLGTLLAAALPLLTGQDNAALLVTLAALLLVALPGAVGVAGLAVGEPRPAPRPAAGWRAGWRVLAANRPFRRLMAAYLLNGIANGLPATLILLFVSHVLQLEALSGLFLAAYFAAGIVSIPLWVAISARWEKHRTWCAAMLLACLAFLPVPLLGPGESAGFLAICVLTGLCLGADLALPPSMQADVVDVDTAAAGASRTGLYFALWGMATKLALALAVGIAFPLLDLSGFDAAAASNGAPALLALTALYALAPVLFKLAAIALMWRYPLGRAGHATYRQRIAAGRASVGC